MSRASPAGIHLRVQKITRCIYPLWLVISHPRDFQRGRGSPITRKEIGYYTAYLFALESRAGAWFRLDRVLVDFRSNLESQKSRTNVNVTRKIWALRVRASGAVFLSGYFGNAATATISRASRDENERVGPSARVPKISAGR